MPQIRWDEVFFDCFGDKWKMVLAQLDVKPAEWKQMMDEFVKKAHVFCEYAIDETNEAKAIGATA